jgi:hypothetical protein
MGMGVAIILCLFQGLGSILAGRIAGKLPDQKLFLTTEGCDITNGTYTFPNEYDPDFSAFNFTNPWKEREDSWEIQIWSISYLWLPGLGIGFSIFFGLLCSGVVNLSTSPKERKLVPKRLFTKPLLKLWKKIFGKEYLKGWIDYSSTLKDDVTTN